MLDELNKCILSLQYIAEIKCIINKNKERARWYNWDMVTSFEDWGETNPLSKEWLYLLLASAICLFSVYAYKYKKYTHIQKYTNTKDKKRKSKYEDIPGSRVSSPSISIYLYTLTRRYTCTVQLVHNIYTLYIKQYVHNLNSYQYISKLHKFYVHVT